MRLSRLVNLFDLKRYIKLSKDFNNPFIAHIAASGVFEKKFKLVTKENKELIVNRGDLPVWKEYFRSVTCTITIEDNLFKILPHNKNHPVYWVQGGCGMYTFSPERWGSGSYLPDIIEKLQKKEKNIYSQHGEDGVIEAILEKISVKHKYLVEFGAHDGVDMSNSRNLIVNHGWNALLIEADKRFFKNLEKIYENQNNIVLLNSFVTQSNINQLFKDAGVPGDFELLSIDVDGPDYYLWEALTEFEPKIVIVEYNSSILPDKEYIVPLDKVFEYGATSKEGASLLAFYNLGKAKGYQAIYTELSGANMFFVHNSIADKFDLEGVTAEALYQPPQFGALAGTSALNGRGYF